MVQISNGRGRLFLLRFFGFLVLASFFAVVCSAASIQVDVNGQYYVGGAVTVSGNVLPAAAHDVNIVLADASTGTISDQNLATADANGYYIKTFTNLSAADYNGLVTDVNSGATNRSYFTVTNYASADINFVGNQMPLNVGQILIANFTLRDYNGNVVSSDYNIALKLVGSNGTAIKDQNNFVPKATGANRSVDYNFGVLSTPGVYTIIMDKGVTGFNIPVIAYNLFSNAYNTSTGEPQKSFAVGQNANIKVFLSYTNGTAITSATVTGTILVPNSTSASAITFTQSGGYFAANTGVLNTRGDYVIRVSASALGYSQTQELKLTVQSYEISLQPKKNASAGKKERMRGAYGAGSQVSLELRVIDLNANTELAGLDLNNACDKNKIALVSYKAGSTLGTTVDYNMDNVPDNECDLNFLAPSGVGEYYYKVTGTDMNVKSTSQNLSASTGLKVQNQIVFLDAVDPASYLQDPNNAWKFTFYQDENIGFVVNTIDLNTSSDSNVSRVTQAAIMQNNQRIVIGSSYLDYNALSHVLTLKGTALTDNNVSAGFVPIEFTVDTNSNNSTLDANGITGFGAFRYKKYNISSTPADVNGISKSTLFGPPVFHSNDENAYLSVKVVNAGGTAVKYASVELYSIRNVDDWNDLAVAPINARADNNNLLTNSNGIALLSLGTLSSGVYFGQVKVTNGSTTDYGDFFLMVKSYIVNTQPMTLGEQGQCQFVDNIGSTSDFNMVVMAMNPAQGTPVNDYLPSTANTKIYLMSKGEEFKEPTEYSATMTLINIDCMGMMGPPGQTNTFKAFTVHPTTSWQSGSYRVLVKGSSSTLGAESGDGFFRVQPFRFSIIPLADPGPGGEKMLKATPGSSFDFNVLAGSDVTLHASLVDGKTQQDINSSLSFTGGNTASANQLKTISVVIPSGIPLSEYPLIVSAEDSEGNTAEQDIFLSMGLFNLSVPSSLGNQNLRYQTTNTGAYDTNILDDASNGNLSHWNKHYCDGNVTVGNISYNRWVMAGTDWAQNDLNHLILASTSDQNMWIDYDNDCNFLDDESNNRHVGDANIGSMTDGNAMLVTDITSMALTYMKNQSDFNNSSKMQGTFIGQYPVDENIGIPIIIKNFSGLPIADVNVTINRAMLLPSFGMGMPTEIASNLWSTTQGTTNGSGFARVVLKLTNPGTYMLEIKATSTSGSQIFKPWEGMVLEAKKYKSELFLVNQAGDITINFDHTITGANEVVVELSDGYFDTNYGIFDESASNFDLDKDGAKEKNFYFIKLSGAFHEANPGLDANLLVDDDNKFCDLLYFGDTNSDNCPGLSDAVEFGLNEAWFDNTSGVFLCPYSTAQGSMQNTSCGNREAVYAVSENDSNVTDNNAVMINRTTWRAVDSSGNNYGLWMLKDGTNNAADANALTWMTFKNLEGVKLNSDGTMNAKLFKTNARPQANVQNIMIPMPGTYTGTISIGIGRINFGNLPDSNYSIAIDVNISNALQTQYENFEVRSV